MVWFDMQQEFVVEMTQTAEILHNSTPKSLIILDELGRGTSTFDGLSIAYAVIKYIADNLKAKTLFSTHYHELTEMEGKTPGLKNCSVATKEADGNIIFLHKIIRGPANKSYGIEVAKLAGLPQEVINDAKQVLGELEKQRVNISLRL